MSGMPNSSIMRMEIVQILTVANKVPRECYLSLVNICAALKIWLDKVVTVVKSVLNGAMQSEILAWSSPLPFVIKVDFALLSSPFYISSFQLIFLLRFRLKVSAVSAFLMEIWSRV